MAYILHLETSTKNCSVALSNGNNLLALKEENTGGYSHAEKLHVFIADVLKEAGVSFKDLNAVAVGKGPGSYTGLRIGVSAAKGICFALDIPLLAMESLEILAHSKKVASGVLIPLLDARRWEVYSAIFDSNYNKVRTTKAEIIDSNSFLDYYSKGKVYLIGDGATKCKEMLTHENIVFDDELFPSAKDMVGLSYAKYKISDIEDVAYFEPYYLKDFVVTKSKKRV